MQWTLDRRKYLDVMEVKKLMTLATRQFQEGMNLDNYIQARNGFTILLALYSGLRVAELTDLQNRDLLNYEKYSYIRVRNGKGNKERLVRINGVLTSCFDKFTKYKRRIGIEVGNMSQVLCKKNSTRLGTRSLQLAFKQSAHDAKLDQHYSIHALRHTYGTHLYRASKYNLRLVQKQLGHASLTVTQVYANVLEEDADKAVALLYR